MPWNETLNDLQSVLADLYPRMDDILRVVRQAGLAPERIELSGKAINTWHEALVQAQLQERVEALMAVARQEYPNNRALARACRAYAPPEVRPPQLAVIPDGALGLRRVFISYATEADGEIAHRLADDLRRRGAAIWMAPESIRAGETWMEAIERGLDESEAMVVLLTPAAVRSKWVRREMEAAISLEMEGRMRILPLYVQACPVPVLWRSYQWIPLADYDAGLARLADELRLGAAPDIGESAVAHEGVPAAPPPPVETRRPAIAQRAPRNAAVARQPFEPELVLIPAGEFLMGSDPAKDKQAYDSEQPQHRLYLPDYYLAKTPVTVAQYEAFVRAAGHRAPDNWANGKPPQGKESHPVVSVDWNDALAYCRWLAEVTGKAYTLPSEAEWEKGARGVDGRIYPWGDDWDAARCNTSESGVGATTPVARYPQGASPYGLLDMAGNVWEWTRSLYQPYPYDPQDGRENLEASDTRVVRGGSWDGSRGLARCASRVWDLPDVRLSDLGFRVVVAPPISPRR